MDDARLVWQWSNDPGVRAVSFNSEQIPWETHVKWFSGKLSDPAVLFLIAEEASAVPVGQMRYEIRDGVATVSLSLAADARGRGLGVEMLKLGSSIAFTRARLIEAFIKPENLASVRLFEKSGYERAGVTEVHGCAALKYVLRMNDAC